MQKAFSLQPHEIQFTEQLQTELQRLTAAYGALMLDMEQAKQQIATGQEKQRSYISSVVMRHGIQQFRNARIEGTNLVCEVPDEAAAAPVPMRLNGPSGDSVAEILLPKLDAPKGITAKGKPTAE